MLRRPGSPRGRGSSATNLDPGRNKAQLPMSKPHQMMPPAGELARIPSPPDRLLVDLADPHARSFIFQETLKATIRVVPKDGGIVSIFPSAIWFLSGSTPSLEV